MLDPLLRTTDPRQVTSDDDNAAGEVTEVIRREEGAYRLGDRSRILDVDTENNDSAVAARRVGAHVAERTIQCHQ